MHKHHVSAMLEFDVTEIRRKLMELRRAGKKVSFNGWLIKVIGEVLQQHPEVAAYLFSKKKLIIFNDVNISILVEKKLGDKKVPIPLVIEKANEKSALTITLEIENAKNQELSEREIVLTQRPAIYERLYYFFPGIIRRAFWKWMLSHPRYAFKKMGNVAFTSVGMMGRINGWFIYRSVHPVSFGIGSVIKKPLVVTMGRRQGEEKQDQRIQGRLGLDRAKMANGNPGHRSWKSLARQQPKR